MTNLLIKTIWNDEPEKFDNDVNEFTQRPNIFVRATQTHVSSAVRNMLIAVVFYEEK
jgi:hypothetical protein